MAHPTADTGVNGSTAEPVVDAVVTWLRGELEDPEIVGSDNFLDIGAHSLTFNRLNRFLAENHGVELDIRTTYDETLADAARAAPPLHGNS